MSDPSRLHVEAQHDLLRAALPANIDVYIGKVGKGDADLRFPYLVLWPSPAARPVDGLDRYAGRADTRTQITGAGTTVDEVLSVLDRASKALHCVTPTIPGRECGWIRMDEDTTASITVDPSATAPDGRNIYVGYLFADLYSTAG